ncbi:unnamed protein product, partial [Anisakis simplex]|uniref:Ovule protein n=1 Tax=Anisakis simplex TaxID=6269 RepID=A0A0M3JIW1_ANISI
MPKKDETETNAVVVGSNVEEEIDEQQMVWEIEKWNREWDIPRLWVGLFRYYVLEHSTKRVVQIRFRDSGDDDERPKDMGHFNCKRIAIE